uniref:Ovule protein n=1 Tax=Mesocestoides corti TaxID=53468 RepID=A0A5K3FWZ5_MESCO
MWHARKASSQPEEDTNKLQFILSGVASVGHSDGRLLTCGSSLWLVNKACSVVPIFFLLELGYSTHLLHTRASVLSIVTFC